MASKKYDEVEKTTDELKKELFESKEKKFNYRKLISVIIWILLFVWMGLCLTDLYKVEKRKQPLFCIKKDIIKYEDGEVENCLGLGYRVYNYKRASFNGIEYGPFWIKDKSNE